MIYNPEGSAIESKIYNIMNSKTYTVNGNTALNQLAQYMCFIKNKTITIQNEHSALKYNKNEIPHFSDSFVARHLNTRYRSDNEYHLTIPLVYTNIVEYATLAKQADFIENIPASLALTTKAVDIRVFSKKDNPKHLAFICKIPNLNAMSSEIYQNICGVALNIWDLLHNSPEVYTVTDNTVTINSVQLSKIIHDLLRENFNPEIKNNFESVIMDGIKPDTKHLTLKINATKAEIERCYEKIQTLYTQLNTEEKNLFVAQHTDNTTKINAFIQGLKCKGIELNAVDLSRKTFTITAYTILSNYNKSDAKTLLKHDDSMWADVMKATLIDELYSFKMHATFTFKPDSDTFDLVSATRTNIAHDIEGSISYANPHIRFYNCYAANKAHIIRALREQHYDMLTPLLKQTAGSFNLLDGPVWNHFKASMVEIQRLHAKDYALWINNKTQKHMTMEEVYNEIHQNTN